jgi:hypothetical protein
VKYINGKWQPQAGVKPSDSVLYAMFMPRKGGTGWDHVCTGKQVLEVVRASVDRNNLDEVWASKVNTQIREKSAVGKQRKALLRKRINALLDEAGYERKAA